MAKFINSEFHYDGLYLTYGQDRRFVARFKYGGMVAFKKFLRDNFTVEEYFAFRRMDIAPLNILQTKGYVSPVMAGVLKEAGYPCTLAGYNQYISDTIDRNIKDIEDRCRDAWRQGRA